LFKLRRITHIIFFLCSCLLVAGSPLSANESFANITTIDLATHIDGEPTGNNYHFLIDDSQVLSIDDVSQATGEWQTPEEGVTNRGFSVLVSWMRFSLKNPSTDSFDAILEYVDPAAESIDIYHRPLDSKGDFIHHNFTYNKPASERPVAFYRPSFPIQLTAQSQSEVYVRIFAGDDFPMHSFTAMKVWEKNSFNHNAQKELSFMIILLCTEIIMGIATLVLFVLTRDKVFLFYTLFVFSAASLFASFSGLWGYFISPERYELWMVVFQISICQIAALLFIRKFLNTQEHLPLVDKIILLVIGIDLLGVILNLLGQPYLSRIIIDFTAIGYFFLVPVGLLSQRKGVPQATLFTASWIIFIIGMALASLRLRGYIEDSFLAQWAIYILLATVMVLYVQLLQKEKAIADARYRLNLENTADELSLKVSQQTHQLRAAKEKAEYEARIDVLTGLTNRRAFVENTTQAIARAKRNQHTHLYLMLIDIDFFKQVNDTYGHIAGDFVLTWVAKITNNVLRETDIVSRIGGEEFAVLMETEQQNVHIEIAERLRTELENSVIPFEKHKIQITISLGLSKYNSPDTLDEFMQKTDKALYEAKDRGRNCVVIHA